jgi:hypothetical protein
MKDTLVSPSPAAGQRMPASSLLAALGVDPIERVQIQQPDDNFTHNRVVAFNASAFAGSNPHEFLSNYAVRYQDPSQSSLNDLANFIAPEVPAQSSQFVEYAIYNFADGYLALDNLNDDIRGIGADFPTLRNPQHQLVTQRIANRGIAVEVDEDEERLDVDWQQLRVQYLMGILQRTRLRRVVTLFAAGATAVSKTWSSGTPDPDMDVVNELEGQSIRATRIIYGPSAWTTRTRAFRAQNTAGGFASARDTTEDRGGMLRDSGDHERDRAGNPEHLVTRIWVPPGAAARPLPRSRRCVAGTDAAAARKAHFFTRHELDTDYFG